MVVITVYRLQFVPVAEFIREFEDILEAFAVLYEDFIIAGDVNIHVETDECPSRKFTELLESYDLRQHISGPTHIKGHTIDVVISPNKPFYVYDINIRRCDLSHHFLIEYRVNVSATSSETKTITYRAWKEVDTELFSQEVKEALLSLPETRDMGEKLSGYNRVLRENAEKFAPTK